MSAVEAAFKPWLHHGLDEQDREHVENMYNFTEQYFSTNDFDSSHDFQHVLRVTRLATEIMDQEERSRKETDHVRASYRPLHVIAAALLHDVGDHKYNTGLSVSSVMRVQQLSGRCASSLRSSIRPSVNSGMVADDVLNVIFYVCTTANSSSSRYATADVR